MYSVLIADDETIIRQGLHYIIDWETTGFQIIGEVSEGESALSFILEHKPDVVLLDIKMPRLSGLDVAKAARAHHYNGKIIILSGYSDFKYAQEAIRYDIKFYLTKPIDAIELEENMIELRHQLDEEGQSKRSMIQYHEKLRKNILSDLITLNTPLSPNDLSLLDFNYDLYQVVLYEKFSHSLADISYNLPSLLRVTNQNNTDFETITINNYEVVILKGSFVLSQFNRFVARMNSRQMPQKGSPLDSLFLTSGRSVQDIQQLSKSYKEAMLLMERRFFCKPNQHTIDYLDLPNQNLMANNLTEEKLNDYCKQFSTSVQTRNTSTIQNILQALEEDLFYSLGSITEIKLFLADLFIRIKEQITFRYYPDTFDLPGNTQIIEYIQSRYYLYQIINFYQENLGVIISTLNYSSGDTVISDVAAYIKHNYMENLKLETLANIFGYNSSYLGKTFTSKIGINFNAYLDKTRIENAIKLLETTDLKVYEIASKVGYRNTDAFHEKFKKETGYTPAEYKRKFQKN